ncbi:MAG: TIR domain-containing protein [Bacteroidaceae bacterium]|nr:TIR domain-containing protein [Bacteroidaceae bacterium]
MEQSIRYHINNSTVKIIFGNILDSQAEVIVNCSGSKMTMGGGLTKAIREAGGEVIRNDAQTKLPVNVGDAVVTTAGRLRQKYVFHCITMDKSVDHSNTPDGISEEDIQQYIIGHSIDKCFLLLHAMELKSIAFPAIGAGAAGIPFDKVASAMAEVIGRNLRKTNKSFNVEIYLYDRFEKMQQWDFLPMFEQFAAQEAIARLLSEQTADRLFADDVNEQCHIDVAPDMDKDIFISYSRKDAEIVKAIYEWLERVGYKCWLDVDGMFSGVSYKKVIVDAIKRSKVLLFMSSENSNKSRNVVSEVSVAVEYGKIIIPVRLDMSSYSESIEYDIINHDYVVYDRFRMEESNREMLKKIVSTMKMV